MAKLAGAVPEVAYRAKGSVHDDVPYRLLAPQHEVGAVLLVGVTGTQLDLGLLRRTGGTALTVSGLNLITPLALGVTLGLFLPATVVASGHTSRVVLALFIGVTMCVSAIPVIAKTLSDMRLSSARSSPGP
jgi:Kef-type K+ transport system membrane component KefB